MGKYKANTFVRQIVARNVCCLRKTISISQTTFAQMISVNRPYFNRVELGRRNVSVDMLAKIADGLDVPITALLEGLAEVPPHQAALQSEEPPDPRPDSPKKRT